MIDNLAYKQNDVVYLVRGTAYAKCVIDEISLHYTQKGIIVKYYVRPYGQKEFITVEENEMVSTLPEAQEVIKQRLEENYVKSLENVETMNEEFFEKMEKNYQKSLKQEK